MVKLLTALAAALFGALLDRLAAWQRERDRTRTALEMDRLQRRVLVDQINRTIDEEIADEPDVRVLLDRL